MRPIIAITLALSLSSCDAPRSPVSNTVFDSMDSSPTYRNAFKGATQSTTIYSKYEKLYTINASFLSREFYSALRETMAERTTNMELLQTLRSNQSLMVSIFSPSEEFNDLSNSRLWDFTLTVNGVVYRAKTVTKIKEKESWYPFFPYISRWSSDFLIVFDIPDSETATNGPFTLTLGSSETKTLMTW